MVKRESVKLPLGIKLFFEGDNKDEEETINMLMLFE
jgi:hypothetical protein